MITFSHTHSVSHSTNPVLGYINKTHKSALLKKKFIVTIWLNMLRVTYHSRITTPEIGVTYKAIIHNSSLFRVH